MILNDNILLAVNDYVKDGTIYATGSENSDYPLSNLALREQWLFGRFEGYAVTDTKFEVYLGGTRNIDLIAYLKHSMGPFALWKVSVADSQAGLAAPTYTSGWIAVSPALSADDVGLEWGEFEWGGTTGLATQASLNHNAYHPLPETVSGSWVRFEFNDESDAPSRSDPYVQGARAWVSGGYQPSVNAAYGAKIQVVDKTGRVEAQSGALQFDYAEVRMRYADISLELPENEMRYFVQGPIMMQQGRKGEIILIKYPTQPGTFVYDAVYGTLEDAGPLTSPFWRYRTADISIRENV